MKLGKRVVNIFFFLTLLSFVNSKLYAAEKKKIKNTKEKKQTKENTKSIEGKKKKKKNEKERKEEIKEEYNDIKNFETYDPVSKKRSKIKDFDTVEILTEGEEEREKELIYRNFWAYDSKTQKWYKVNIPNYGIENPSFWEKLFRNLAFDVSIGPEFGNRNLNVDGDNIGIISDLNKNEAWISSKKSWAVSKYRLVFLGITDAQDFEAKK